MERRRLAIFVLSIALASALALAGLIDGVDTGLLFLAPAFLLLLPLAAGRYVGEEQLARWASTRSVRRWRPAARLVPRGRSAAVLGAAGLLLARRLAGRAPPAMVPAAA